jgi:toxin ParE1/3/4
MNKRYEIFIYPKAEKDMEDIFQYVCNELGSPKAARDIINKFENALDNISLFSDSCPYTNNEAIIDKEIRKLIIDNYIVFYKADKENRQINVIRVIYGMRNYADIL